MTNLDSRSATSIAIANGTHRFQMRVDESTYTICESPGGIFAKESAEWAKGKAIQFRMSKPSTVEAWDGSNHFGIGIPSSIRFANIFLEAEVQHDLQSLDVSIRKPLRRIGKRGSAGESSLDLKGEVPVPAADTLSNWFEALGALQRHATNSDELYQHVAQAIVDPGGLDSASVLTFEDNLLATKAYRAKSEPVGITLQDALVANAIELEQTVATGDAANFYGGAIASPFFDANGKVVGVLYGSRALTSENRRCRIRPLEAYWIQVVSEALTAGFKRFATEQKEARTRYVYGRSFSPPLLKAFQEDSQILTPQEREVTVMFADLRRFTSISEKIGSERSFQILTDVMNRWTEAIMRSEGVILDFYGDGLAAMWNAPVDQADHANRACQTPFEMQKSISQLVTTGLQGVEPLQIAIGIATGKALVGNAGSDLRTKYGPRGTTVNLGSRLESAAKRLDVPILISEATRRFLDEGATTRRIGLASLPGLAKGCAIYELLQPTQLTSDHEALFDLYERALDLYEQERLEEACDLLESLRGSSLHIGGTDVLYEAATAKPQKLAPSISLLTKSYASGIENSEESG